MKALLTLSLFLLSKGFFFQEMKENRVDYHITQKQLLRPVKIDFPELKNSNSQNKLDTHNYLQKISINTTQNVCDSIEYRHMVWDGTKWINKYKETRINCSDQNLKEYRWQIWCCSASTFVNNKKLICTYDDQNRTISLFKFWKDTKWTIDFRYLFNYENNNCSEWLIQDYIDSNWILRSRRSYSYDENNRWINYKDQIWSNSDWINLQHYFAKYDNNGDLIDRLWQLWRNQRWVNLYRWKSSYVENKKSLKLRQMWKNGEWIDERREIHTWNNNVLNILVQYRYDKYGWVNFCSEKYDYNDNNRLLEYTYQYWNWEISDWKNLTKRVYTYNGLNKSEELCLKWKNSEWNNFLNYEYTYDDKHNLTSRICQIWNNSLWIKSTLDSITYFYLLPSKVKTKYNSNFSISQNYPNPFNPVTTIKYNIPIEVGPAPPQAGGQRSDVRLVVYDVLGRKVETLVNEKQKPGNYKVLWDGTNLSSGVYFYELVVGDNHKVKKMVLLK